MFVLILQGCEDTCEGADCGALYPRATLGRFGGDRLLAAEVDPEAPDAALDGTDADGFDWAVLGVTDGALVGVPAAGEVRRHDFAAGTTATVLASEVAEDRFGAALALGTGPTGGTRLLVGAPESASGPLLAAGGVVYVYDADSDALDALGAPTRTLLGARAGDRVGEGVWACADLDGDGVSDWAAGSSWADGATPAGGTAPALAGALYLGLSAALPVDRALTTAALPTVAGTTAGARFGAAAACDRSLDGDAFAELVVGAPFADVTAGGTTRDAAGTVELWRGGAGFGEAVTLRLHHEEPGAWFGAALALGDLDGDGLPELVVGAPGEDRPGEGASGLTREDGAAASAEDVAGAVYVYAGTDLEAELRAPALTLDPAPVRELHGEFSRGRFGAALQLADLDGDGVLDLVIGAPGHNRSLAAASTRAGAATVWWGPYTAWPEVQFASDAPSTLVADRQYLETGRVLAATPATDEEPASLLVLVREPALAE